MASVGRAIYMINCEVCASFINCHNSIKSRIDHLPYPDFIEYYSFYPRNTIHNAQTIGICPQTHTSLNHTILNWQNPIFRMLKGPWMFSSLTLRVCFSKVLTGKLWNSCWHLNLLKKCVYPIWNYHLNLLTTSLYNNIIFAITTEIIDRMPWAQCGDVNQ